MRIYLSFTDLFKIKTGIKRPHKYTAKYKSKRAKLGQN